MKKSMMICMLAACLLLTGCMSGVLAEDSIYEALPPIDPESGISTMNDVSLYLLLGDTGLLYPVKRSIEKRANERIEMAMMRELLQGEQDELMNSAFGEGTRVVSMTMDGGILYLTMSRELLDTQTATGTQPSAQAAAQIKRQRVASIVNTIISAGNAKSVLILTDLDGTGIGTRVSGSELGFEGELADALVEPVKFEDSFVATPAMLAELALKYVVNGEFGFAARYFTFDAAKGGRPELEELVKGFGELGLTSYIVGDHYTEDELNYVEISLITDAGTHVADIPMAEENGILKLDYYTFISAAKGE